MTIPNRVLRAAMALAHKDTLAQWNALLDHEAKRYMEDAERALLAAGWPFFECPDCGKDIADDTEPHALDCERANAQ